MTNDTRTLFESLLRGKITPKQYADAVRSRNAKAPRRALGGAARGESLSGFPHHRDPFAGKDPCSSVGVGFIRKLRQIEPSSFAPRRLALSWLVDCHPAGTALLADGVSSFHLVPPYLGNPDASHLTRGVK